MSLIPPPPERIADFEAVIMALDEVNHPHPDNPRDLPAEGSPKREALKASLKHDYFDPIIWNRRNGRLVAGHVRTPLMIELGFTHAKVIVVDYDEPTHLARMKAANEHSGKNNEGRLESLLIKLRVAEVDPVLALMTSLVKSEPKPRKPRLQPLSISGYDIAVECPSQAERERAHKLLGEHGFTCRLA